jgi:hypothetical protein
VIRILLDFYINNSRNQEQEEFESDNTGIDIHIYPSNQNNFPKRLKASVEMEFS